MAAPSPVVLEGIDIPGLIQYVLDKHTAPSTIVVCSSKDAFLKQLQAALTEHAAAQAENVAPRQQLLTKRTLRLLAFSRTVKLVFCPELAHLRAYLATYPYCDEASSPSTAQVSSSAPFHRILVILNPIQIHKPTSAFSAQGINRTFATAVDAASATGSQLIFAECPHTDDSAPTDEAIPFADDSTATAVQAEGGPWDEAVSILNVTTKSFGTGERGWVGRTVTVRSMAGRWCRFFKTNDV
jgi:hypothetical protein